MRKTLLFVAIGLAAFAFASPALAITFASGRGAAVQPMLLAGGVFVVLDSVIEASAGVFAGSQNSEVRRYLDSLHIASSQFGIGIGWGASQTSQTALVNSAVTNTPAGVRSYGGDLIVSLAKARSSRSAITRSAAMAAKR